MSASNLKLTDFEVISIIGTGSSGTCFKVKNKHSGKIFVWKSIGYDQISEEKKNIILTEIKLLRELKHPNIVRYYDHIIYNETKTLYIIMECCDGGDLGKLIKKCKKNHCHFEEEFIWRVLYQLAKALQGCQLNKTKTTVLHRDIKPANVFLDLNGNVKLGDFGLARVLNECDSFADTLVGTPYYMSPEIVKGVKYNRKSDVWSLGCLIYEMCALIPPFDGNKFEQLSKNINDGFFKRIPDMYSDDLQQIITFMLSVDHGIRPTVEILLHHPTVLKNLSKTNHGYPCLIVDHVRPVIEKTSLNKGLEFIPNPNLTSTTINELSLDKKSTPELRKELFGSINNKMNLNLLKSEFDIVPIDLKNNLTKNKLIQEYVDGEKNDKEKPCKLIDPNEITQEIFDQALKQRLHAIRAKESLLKQREIDLNEKEQQLMKREKFLQKTENNIRSINKRSVSMPFTSSTSSYLQKSRRSIKLGKKNLNDSQTTVEPNDTIIEPTVAKFNPQQIPRPKILQNKILFKSPQKFKNYNIENVPPIHEKPSQSPPQPSSNSNNHFNNKELLISNNINTVNRQYTHSMKYTQKDLENAVIKNFALISTAISPSKNQINDHILNNKTNKRKSLFSNIFNLNNRNLLNDRNGNLNSNTTNSVSTTSSSSLTSSCSASSTTITSSSNIILTNPEDITSKWNAENKKTAFEMLAILNSADEGHKLKNNLLIVNDKIIQRDRRRKSMIIYRKNTNL